MAVRPAMYSFTDYMFTIIFVIESVGGYCYKSLNYLMDMLIDRLYVRQ